ncbi:MAG: helix-turn-helix domain-containing protein [Caldilineaceae bacterium]
MTMPEAREYLRVSKTTLYNLMKDGRLPFFYISGTRQRRVKRIDLDALLEPGRPDELNESEDDPE